MTKRFGLALGSGGIRGAAHVGVIKCLEDNKIKIDYIAGCSAGALVGALYGLTGSADAVAKYLDEINFTLAGKKYMYFLEYRRMLGRIKEVLGDKLIEDLKTPLATVATDIENGQPYIFEKGSLVQAVGASVAVPVVMPTTFVPGKHLVDGGLVMPVPVEVARKKAEIVLAVNLYHDIFPIKYFKYWGKVSMLFQSIYSPIFQLSKYDCAKADIVIEPDYLTPEVKSKVEIERMIDSGYRATKEQLPKIKKLLG